MKNYGAAVQPADAPAPIAAARTSSYVQQTPAPAPVQDDLTKRLDTLSNNIAGFKFSGDFRLRADVQARTGNAVAVPLQNVRSRYRVRLNFDKDIDAKLRFHLQLSTGPYNNQITNDQDFGAMAVKQPFSVSEAYVDYRPTSRISLRGGRMEEVFADNMRFLWDDDVVSTDFSKQPAFHSARRHLRRLNSRPASTF